MLMRHGFLLALPLMFIVAIVATPSLAAMNDNPDYVAQWPAWNVGDIVKNYPNYTSSSKEAVVNINGAANNCTHNPIDAGCEVWHECAEGSQKRVCETFNPCDNSVNKAVETRNCTTESVPILHSNQTNATTSTIQNQTMNISKDITNATSGMAQNESVNVSEAYPNATSSIARNNSMNVSEADKSAHANDTINTTKGKGYNRTGIWSNTSDRDESPSVDIDMEFPSGQPAKAPNTSAAPEQEKAPAAIANITKVYDAIEPNATVVVPIEKPESAMRQIKVEVISRAAEVQITVAERRDKPEEARTEAAVMPGQRVYSYIDISHKNLSNTNIRNASIAFDVKKVWIRQNSINASTVRLSRYENEWKELRTKVTGESEDTIHYEAESPGMSIFAIVGEQMLQYTGKICVPLDRRCAGKTMEECSMDGGAWEKLKDCEHACRIDRCMNATEAKEGSQEEVNMLNYAAIIIIMLLLLVALGVIASYFRNKANAAMLRIERERIK